MSYIFLILLGHVFSSIPRDSISTVAAGIIPAGTSIFSGSDRRGDDRSERVRSNSSVTLDFHTVGSGDDDLQQEIHENEREVVRKCAKKKRKGIKNNEHQFKAAGEER